jgi:DNA repair exonuclease SbcCD ATPase subunit
MNVTIEKLRLSYFKGIKSLEMDFTDGENFIHGKNASGKTTVFDAVWFLFFGKDSTGRADFTIKTLDSNNKPIEKVDHEVFGQFTIDGHTKTFQRTYKQQWSKENILKGHTTEYEIDGFPVRLESEYKKAVEQFFGEELFKLLTNPLFFNSMKPADRRAVLINMAAQITDAQVFDTFSKKTKHLKQLEETLNSGAKLEQIKLKSAKDKKEYKDQKDEIPNRIDEAERSKPELYDFTELDGLIKDKKSELAEIENKIQELSSSDTAYNKNLQAWNNQLFEAKTQLQTLTFKAEQEYARWKNDQEKFPRETKAKIQEVQAEISRIQNRIMAAKSVIADHEREKDQIQSLISNRTAEKNALVEEWKAENAKEFTWNGSTCTACDRPLEGSQALDAEEQARTKFNKAKADRIKEIEQKGSNLKGLIERNNQQIKEKDGYIQGHSLEINEMTAKLSQSISELEALQSSLQEYNSGTKEVRLINDFLSSEAKALQEKITSLEANKPVKGEVADTSELQATKATILNTLEEFQKALGSKDTIERINKRIAELKEKEKELAQAITDAEGLENACFDFGKAKVEMIEAEINSKFSLVSFKLFEIQLNGNEKEVCETLYNGVPFNDLNNAGKIQAGLDIIKTLSAHHNLYLPIFIDNRESVTWLPSTNSQLINLVVDPTAEKLELKPVLEFATV